MGMRAVSGGSQAWATQSNNAVGNWQQRQQGVKDLFTALKAGDLGAAQKAFSALTPNNATASSNGPLAKIGQALQKGDVAGAQQLAQTMQAQRAGHHHQGGSSLSSWMPTAPSSASAESLAASIFGLGSQVNVTA